MSDYNILRGKFITFEGGEGVGKSTQSKKLVQFLNNIGIESIWTREPGGCEGAEEIRNLIINGSVDRWDGTTELLLMSAARRVHTEVKVKPQLEKGTVVVCDRYLDSTIAYQGFGEGLNVEDVEKLQKIVLGDFVPDLTILLDMDVEKALERSFKTGEVNRFEEKALQFHQRVRNGFAYVEEKCKNRCRRLQVENKDEEQVFKEVLEIIGSFFGME